MPDTNEQVDPVKERPLPKWFVCIDPDEIPLVIALLRDRDRTNEHKEARLHLALCAHCKGFVGAVVVACVEKVKAMRDEWNRTRNIGPVRDTAKKSGWIIAANQIIPVLESLTQGEIDG